MDWHALEISIGSTTVGLIVIVFLIWILGGFDDE